MSAENEPPNRDVDVELERLDKEQFEKFRKFIYDKCGIRFEEQKITLLSNRIRRRLKLTGCDSFDDYFRFITSRAGATELGGFIDAVTTNETFFFRTEKHFDWLKTTFLADQIEQRRSGAKPASLRIWSAGCASGAEPYSIAICLLENMFQLRDWDLDILGTDISEAMLEAAREGLYPEKAVDTVDERQLRRYFKRHVDELKRTKWEVRDELKNLTRFQQHNLMQPLREPPFDCIFIRNVLIYFDRESKQHVINNLIAQLSVGGYLAIGPSEGAYEFLGDLQRVSPLVYQKVDGSKRAPSGAGVGGV